MNDYFDQHKSLSAGPRHLLIIDKNNDVIAAI